MNAEHQFSFDNIFFCAESLSVLDNGNAVFLIDEIGDVGALPFEEASAGVALRGDKHILYLLTQIGDNAGALHQLQLVGSAMFLCRGVATRLLCAIFVGSLRG